MGNLNSGVNILPDMLGNQRDMVTLFNGIARSKAQENALQQEADQKKYEPFYSMMKEISLKGLEGKALESAMKKYNELGGRWTQVMKETEGKPNWEQMLELQSKKDNLLSDLDAYRAFSTELPKAYKAAMIDGKDIDRGASLANLERIKELDPREGLKELGSYSYLVEKPKEPLSYSKLFKDKSIGVGVTTNVDGNVRWDRKDQEARVDQFLSTPEGKAKIEEAKASGVEPDEFRAGLIEEGRNWQRNEVRTKSSSGGSGSGKDKTILPIGNWNGSDRDSNGVVSEYTYNNGHVVKTGKEADSMQLDAKLLMPLNEGNGKLKDDEGKGLTGPTSIRVNEAKVGWVARNSGNAITINGKKYLKGNKIPDKELEAFKSKGGKIMYTQMVNTLAGSTPVEIWASEMTPLERKEFGITDRVVLSESEYENKFGGGTQTEATTSKKKPNKFGI